MQLPSPEVFLSWPVPNYKDPVTRGPANLIVNISFFLLALFVVCLRLYARIKISKSFGWDDGLIVAAMFPATAFAIIGMLTATKYEWDRHIWDVKWNLIKIGLQLSIVSEVLFALATNLTKLSILSLIYRIVSQGPGVWSKLIISAMILIIAQTLAFIFSILFQCGTPSAYWKLQFAPQPECMSETKNLLAAGIVNTVTDFIVVVLPMPMVFKLQLPTKQQIAIAILFGVGFLVTLAGAARTVYLYRTTSSWDKTWLAYTVYIASSVELYIGIICASIPATKTFIAYFMPKFLATDIVSSSHPSKATEATFITTEDLSKMNSVVIGSYDSVIPLDEYQDGKHTTNPSRQARNTARTRHTICVFPPRPTKDRSHTPDSGAETIYEFSKAESHEDLIIQRSPVVLSRPPPSYRQSR